MRRLVAAVLAGLALVVPAPAVADHPVDHRHASQRYDRSLQLLRDELRRHTAAPTDLVTWTEVQSRARAGVLHRRDDGWAALTDRRTDVAIMWRRSSWRAERTGIRLLTHRTYWTTGGFVKRTWMLYAVLDQRGTGERLLVTVGHLPANAIPQLPLRVAAWWGSLDGWARTVRELRQRWRADDVLTVADWNVSLRNPRWRQLVNQRFPGELTWRRPLPRRGTHGTGIIDGSVTTLQGRAHVLRHTRASDHTAYAERLR